MTVSKRPLPTRALRPTLGATDIRLLPALADYIGAGASNCTLRAASTAALNVTYNPTVNPCDEIDLTIHSGVGPFTVSFLAGGIGLYANATNVNSTTPRITNPVAAGNGFNMFGEHDSLDTCSRSASGLTRVPRAVTDSTGNTSIVSPTMTSKRGLAGCSTPTPTATPAPVKKSGLSLGGVIGGVLAGVFAALAVLAIGLFLLRRRRAREAEEALARELEGSSEYKQDGAVPLVTPFVLPSKGPGGGGHGGGEGSGSNSSPTSYVNPYQPNEDATTGGYGSRDSAYDSPVDSRRGSDYGYPSYPPPGGSLRPREESAYSAAQASAGGFHSPHSPYGGLPDQGYGYDHGPTSATELAPGQVEYAEALGAPYPGYTPGLPHGLPGHEGYEEEDGTVDGLAHPASFNYR